MAKVSRRAVLWTFNQTPETQETPGRVFEIGGKIASWVPEMPTVRRSSRKNQHHCNVTLKCVRQPVSPDPLKRMPHERSRSEP